MCGITALYNKSRLSADVISRANSTIVHRGPDDEGFLLWRPETAWRMYAGQDSAEASRTLHQLPLLPIEDTAWQVGLGHRRLSVLDLTPQGHQPMTLDERFAITYNGEVYNYLEIRQELETLGHAFHTGSDTEVILHAWQQWGPEALHRFNGMFAFVLLDASAQKLYAVRDRFGVKPLYYTDCAGYLAFASEVKQLRTLPEYYFVLQESIAYDYLAHGMVDHTTDTFESGIFQLPPGALMELDLRDSQKTLHTWYNLPFEPWQGSFEEACDAMYLLLKDSVRLRLRSDVPVGSALSGGLDSSTIVCLMREILNEQENTKHSIETVTSCQEDPKYDEWHYAEQVIAQVNAHSHQVFPDFEQLTQDFDQLVWHMDYPFGSTSQFSQWCVFEGASKAGLTVMIDGQGADEQLAGYGGNDLALYIGLLSSGQWGELSRETLSYNRRHGHWPLGFLLGTIQHHLPSGLIRRLPKKYQVRRSIQPDWLRSPTQGVSRQNLAPGNLRENLLEQMTGSPLPSLLRYEDRNSMAFSIESRVPFLDYRLIEFTLSLPERFIYRRGIRKHILRQSFAGRVPEYVLQRQDKMGFVSPEERWIKSEGRAWFEDRLTQAADSIQLLGEPKGMKRYADQIIDGKIPFEFGLWRVINYGCWMNSMD